MYKLLFAIFVSTTLANASALQSPKACTFSQNGAVSIHWKAYKTPAKIGVGGVFENITYTPSAPSADNLQKLLVGSTAVIDEKSVNSKNKGRDTKLVKFFFDMMSGENIQTKIIDLQPYKEEKDKPGTGTLTVEIMMNGISRKVPMKYTLNKDVLDAEGTIDLFDFSAGSALKSINKACFKLHKGKTWNDVSIGFTTHIKSVCHPIK